MILYQIYKLLSFLFYPLCVLLLLFRVKKGKEDSIRYKEKLAIYTVPRSEGKLIWFHAASIGELNAILPIIKEIPSQFNVLLTTVTLTAEKIARNNLPANTIHQFAPIDSIVIIRKFVQYWKPDLVIWTESELWPNMIVLAKQRADILLVNARLSKKSYDKWRLVSYLAKFILTKFNLILAQSKETENLLKKLGAENVQYLGNLKFTADNFFFNQEELNYLSEQIKYRFVCMAASTHPGEEEIFAHIHKDLKIRYPYLLTVIAPRHIDRKEEILPIFNDLNVVTRSSGDAVTDDTDILLVDTIGEFGLFFRLSNIVCVGGSWCKVGHSFLEAAKLDNLIIFGPQMDNSRELSDNFLQNKAALLALNAIQIQKILENYMKDPDNFISFKNNAHKLLNEMAEVKKNIITKIQPFIKKLY